MPITERTVVAISAGLSRPSSTTLLMNRIAARTRAELSAAGLGARIDAFELRDVAHPITDALLTGFASGELSRVLDAVTHADGLILATPTFTAAYSGLFKSFLDVLEADTLSGMPVLLAATGGTARHSLTIDHAMRPALTYLHADVVTTGVFAATDDWADAANDERSGSTPLPERITRAARELACKLAHYTRSGRSDPYASTPDFTELLGG